MFYFLFSHLLVLFILYLIFFNKEYFSNFFKPIGIYLPNNGVKYYKSSISNREKYDFKI